LIFAGVTWVCVFGHCFVMLAGSPNLGIGFFHGGVPKIYQTQHGVVFPLVVVSRNSYPYYPEVNTGIGL